MFLEFLKATLLGTESEKATSPNHPPRKQKGWALIPEGDFPVWSGAFSIPDSMERGPLTGCQRSRSHTMNSTYTQFCPLASRQRCFGKHSGSHSLAIWRKGQSWRAFLYIKFTMLIYPSFHREQQAVFRGLSNSCAFQTKTLLRKMIRTWAVCFSGIWWDFPTQTALCVLLKDEALTSRVAKAWWMTWSSQFTFGWCSELNRQKCLGIWWTMPDLFRLVFDGVGRLRFAKRTRAGLLQRMTPNFLLGQ